MFACRVHFRDFCGKLCIAVNPVFREEVQRPRRLFEIVDFRPMLIAPAFLRLDAVLNVNNKGDTAALLLRGFGSAGAPALDTLRYGFLCMVYMQ